ncbi:Microtubule-severing ATPase [Tepidanaerobacter acetatoxydans Re1]|uniref:Microtubule-severing ATPase n=1 Tax=Tepidanaerobacter acetatoxydans (strain DSM 21804 / JCM 16047 / Re1) TaxID=1209989 RepID=F4LUA4_TEPAE|nr:AAA family ATPase [Tepidanaerobacter acetatoxydans]AEE91434.1 Microtubule-severing ATPase [Tepidanaerobacter acetatoxydans Re1]CCP26138.1 Microtubule-severing ATPase [Tepidanaerobacter acetatoxydans Re1]
MLLEFGIGLGIAFLAFLLINGINVLPIIIMIGFAYMLFNILDRGNLMKNPARIISNTQDITFDKIGGQEVAKNELLEALDFIKNFDEAKKMGIRPLRGIMLVGAPGTGKTLMAKAATSYIDSIFVSASGSEFIEMYAGVGAQRVRQLFEVARNMAKKASKKHGVVFIDEIEVIAGTRGRNASHLEYDQTLNQLLVEMDGISSHDDINLLVIAATNRPDIIDPALMRPGRFDRIVKVDLPDKDGRLEILKLHTKDKPLDIDVDLEQIAKETFGFSGAHLENLCNEAAIFAMREQNKKISQKNFIEAIDKVIMGEKLNRKPTEDERKRIAIHESGHALVSEHFNPNSVSTITITSRGQALGYIRQTPEDDIYLYTKQYLESQIAVALAGAVAEEKLLGDSSTGASNDFEQAVDLAKKIIFSGMSELSVVDKDSLPSEKLHKVISNILLQQKSIVENIIEEKQDVLKLIVDYLMENEKIDGNNFRKLLLKSQVA